MSVSTALRSRLWSALRSGFRGAARAALPLRGLAEAVFHGRQRGQTAPEWWRGAGPAQEPLTRGGVGEVPGVAARVQKAQLSRSR